MLPIWREWMARRELRSRAAAYVRTLGAEPPDDDVAWLAANATGGDVDHARWELRYARRAIALIAAQRDALDDRTASVVAQALGEFLARDSAVAPGKLRVAEQQLNARLRRYADAMTNREGAGTGWHLGRALLEFAGRREPVAAAVVGTASDILARYMAEANTALRDRFGTAMLPEDVPPSELRSGAR